ncbi:TetR/AcrR family transcriptional regulator [Rhodococcus qingshengii]|uniref:TetR/AcrR family transcriptional regulator n=1 Tax=Rhodococcus qingshengii TaxID=334542 RepID=UPI00237CB458|nr:TetR/AcrR family transcriptional regulator [Rhodococcus qingshengii]WCT05769.1 TetR/AcrR family transcriptional regulator [Rhodococcus qingshengii]
MTEISTGQGLRGATALAASSSPGVRTPRMTAPERRTQLTLLAAHRFHEVGFHRISLASLATEVGLTAPAVYRHFRNKDALLAAAIASGLDRVEDALQRTTGSPLDDLIVAIAEAGLERPDLWVLLQRESRFLGPELRNEVQDQFARVIDGIIRRLHQERPSLSDTNARLLVTAATAALSSPSLTSSHAPKAEYRQELSAAALACLRFDIENVTCTSPTASPTLNTEPPSRRTEIIDSATDLFFRNGYDGVSLDDIGSSIGIAGPSILHHFKTKNEILEAALDRATNVLSSEHERRRATNPPPNLDEIVADYVNYCLRNRSLLGVYVSDAIHLPPDALTRTRSLVREDISNWSIALESETHCLSGRLARIRVRAAMSAIHDLVRLGHHFERPCIAAEAGAISLAIMAR